MAEHLPGKYNKVMSLIPGARKKNKTKKALKLRTLLGLEAVINRSDAIRCGRGKS